MAYMPESRAQGEGAFSGERGRTTPVPQGITEEAQDNPHAAGSTAPPGAAAFSGGKGRATPARGIATKAQAPGEAVQAESRVRDALPIGREAIDLSVSGLDKLSDSRIVHAWRR